ncbi:hypothetical protein IAR55_002328 [Kwoniella newhampshirensis]|uniref:Ubiquinol-cytochrome c chaperone domain-containing protein n=1 Tax=Kwoniella newhampshirensis TaxID=1651941 RepID=A0AAW0YU17_9TREE
MRPSTSLLPLLSSSSRSTYLPLSRSLHATAYRLNVDTTKPTSIPKTKSKFITDRPVKVDHRPVFPPPHNPFEPPPPPKQYSDLTLRVLHRINKMAGYNGRRRTSARESGRMMNGIVDAVQLDKAFWYGECDLPKTFHTFFAVHLLYVLVTLVRLRALHNDIPNPLSPLPQSPLPGPPGTTPPPRSSLYDTMQHLVAPRHEYRYQQMLLTHFFNIVENEIRLMLGAEVSRDSAIRRRMVEYSQRWQIAQMTLDYSLGLSKSTQVEEREGADAELASWVWRLIFGGRGSGENGQGDLVYPEGEGMVEGKELQMAEQIDTIVKFMRRELKRLESIDDRDVIAGNVGRFGKVRS